MTHSHCIENGHCWSGEKAAFFPGSYSEPQLVLEIKCLICGHTLEGRFALDELLPNTRLVERPPLNLEDHWEQPDPKPDIDEDLPTFLGGEHIWPR